MTTPLARPGVPPLPAAPADRPLAGILLLLGAMVIVPGIDAFAKYLSADYSTPQIVWARFFFHFAILAPLVLLRYRDGRIIPARPVFQLLRGGCLLAATLFFFGALRSLPIADTLAVFFVSPLIVTILSAVILKEQVGVRRWSAVLVGFAGILIIARPGGAVFHPAALLALGAGISYAVYAIMTRKLSGSAPPLVTLAYTALLGAIVMSLVMPFYWRPPSPTDWVLMACLGLFAAAGHFLVILAFERAPASLLAPYGYSEIVTATVLGYVIFGDFPDAVTWVGVAIVVASGVYISIREGRRR